MTLSAAARGSARFGLPGWLVPASLLLLAAALRLPDLATRGTWDADQGHDMLVLRTFVRDGVVPLLGPPTSIGDVHHGALYYYLLTPAAALTGGDSPVAVVLVIALAGIAAVGVTWWLARAIGGQVAGFVAGLAMAISPAAIDESTFIWNPNLIGLSSAIALAGAWHAWTTKRTSWWLLAAAGTAVTMQSHVLGVTLLPVVAALLVADVRRRGGVSERREVARAGLAGLAIIALAFVPLVINELTTNFSEVNAALAYIRAGSDGSEQGLLTRFLVVGLRVVSWPLVGLILDSFSAAVIATVVVIAIAVWRSKAGTGDESLAARWLGLGLLWSTVALTFISPSLASVVRGLPNDHYHAFADPMVFVLVGLAAGALWRARPASEEIPVRPGRILAVAGVAVLVAWAATHQLPAVHPDGGFPAAEAAAARIEAASGGQPIQLESLPDFKSVEAYAYPLVRGGRTVTFGAEVSEAVLRPAGASGAPTQLVVICDVLFEHLLGAPCGGPAEAALAPGGSDQQLIERFSPAPGRVISIYRLDGGP